MGITVEADDILKPNETVLPTEARIYKRDLDYIRTRIENLITDIDTKYVELADLLYEVYSKQYYKIWGFKNWRDYIVSLKFGLRRIQYLISLKKWVDENITDARKRQRFLSLGWSKAKEFIGVVNDENVDEITEKAAKLKTVEVVEVAREIKTGKKPDRSVNELTNLMFSVFPEQRENIEYALQLAQEKTKSDKRGHLLDMICVEYIANNSDDLVDLLGRLEKVYNIRIAAFDETNKLVYANPDLNIEVDDE